jgi:Ca2+-binding RTX toxin-like protein
MTRAIAVLVSSLVLVLPASAAARTLVGTPGKDRLAGGSKGPHVINGDGGGDKIFGGPFNDRLLGEWGGDDVYGRGGDDVIAGGSGGDILVGAAGNDSVTGGFGGDKISGGDGDDFLDGEAAGDDIDAGAGNDTVHGGSGTDQIVAGPGNDTVHSDSSGDYIYAGEGNDVVYVNNGSAVNMVDCGVGSDVLHINPQGMRGGYSNQRSLREGRFTGCERIVETPPVVDPTEGIKVMTPDHGGTARGTERNDNLLGSYRADTIFGFGGNDIIWANRKPDGVSSGIDRVDAGAGDDTVYGASRGGETYIDGGDGNDYLQGGGATATNHIVGGAGADTIRLTGHGFNEVDAGPGDDIVYVYNKDRVRVVCGPGNDVVKIGYNRGARTRGCEKVSRRYR